MASLELSSLLTGSHYEELPVSVFGERLRAALGAVLQSCRIKRSSSSSSDVVRYDPQLLKKCLAKAVPWKDLCHQYSLEEEKRMKRMQQQQEHHRS